MQQTPRRYGSRITTISTTMVYMTFPNGLLLIAFMMRVRLRLQLRLLMLGHRRASSRLMVMGVHLACARRQYRYRLGRYRVYQSTHPHLLHAASIALSSSRIRVSQAKPPCPHLRVTAVSKVTNFPSSPPLERNNDRNRPLRLLRSRPRCRLCTDRRPHASSPQRRL